MRFRLPIACAVLTVFSPQYTSSPTIAPESHSVSYKQSLYRHWIDEVDDKLGTRQQARPQNTGEFRISAVKRKKWRPQRESNPCLHCERVVS